MLEWLDVNIDNKLYRGALVYDVDPTANIASYIDVDDIIIYVDGQELGLFKNQITPHCVTYGKLPTQSVTIQYYKSNENYSILRTSSIILTKYPNNANFDSSFMSTKDAQMKKITSKEFLLSKMGNLFGSPYLLPL